MARLSTRTRAALAGGLVAVAGIISVPARAADEPVLMSTSVDGGWGAIGTMAARFDRYLSPDSTAELKDKDGVVVPGTVKVAASIGTAKDSLYLTPTPGSDQPLSEAKSPYTVTFTAKGALETEGTITVTRSFTFDLTKPVARIASPADGDLFLSGEMITLDGSASDPKSTADKDGVYRSGLVGVEVQFYNLLQNLSPTAGSKEVRSLRQSPALEDCTPDRCEEGAQKAWSADTSRLTTGYWTVKVYSLDLAGNRSVAAEVSFAKL